MKLFFYTAKYPRITYFTYAAKLLPPRIRLFAFLLSLFPPITYLVFSVLNQISPLSVYNLAALFWLIIAGPLFLFLFVYPQNTLGLKTLSKPQNHYLNRIISLFLLKETHRFSHKDLKPESIPGLYFYRAAIAYTLQLELLLSDYAPDPETLQSINKILQILEKEFLARSSPQLATPYLEQLFASEKFLFTIIGSLDPSVQKNIIWGQPFEFESLRIILEEQIQQIDLSKTEAHAPLIYEERFDNDLYQLIGNTIYALPYENFASVFRPILLFYYLSALLPDIYAPIGETIQSIFDIGFGYRRWWGPYLTLLFDPLDVLPSPNLSDAEISFLNHLSEICSELVASYNAQSSTEFLDPPSTDWLLNQALRARASLEVKDIFPLS